MAVFRVEKTKEIQHLYCISLIMMPATGIEPVREISPAGF